MVWEAVDTPSILEARHVARPSTVSRVPAYEKPYSAFPNAWER
jgi:hypothetical protein